MLTILERHPAGHQPSQHLGRGGCRVQGKGMWGGKGGRGKGRGWGGGIGLVG